MEWFMAAMRNYATFEGRARRKEYWMFTLFNVLIALAAGVVAGVLVAVTGSPALVLLAYIPALATFVPSLAVMVRRLHDTDRSGWMFLLSFIPVVGPFIVLYFLCQEGTANENRFGADPKAA